VTGVVTSIVSSIIQRDNELKETKLRKQLKPDTTALVSTINEMEKQLCKSEKTNHPHTLSAVDVCCGKNLKVKQTEEVERISTTARDMMRR
jgi:hypothetical protein